MTTTRASASLRSALCGLLLLSLADTSVWARNPPAGQTKLHRLGAPANLKVEPLNDPGACVVTWSQSDDVYDINAQFSLSYELQYRRVGDVTWFSAATLLGADPRNVSDIQRVYTRVDPGKSLPRGVGQFQLGYGIPGSETFGGPRRSTTRLLFSDASAEDVRRALLELDAIPDKQDIQVMRSEPNDVGTFQWTIILSSRPDHPLFVILNSVFPLGLWSGGGSIVTAERTKRGGRTLLACGETPDNNECKVKLFGLIPGDQYVFRIRGRRPDYMRRMVEGQPLPARPEYSYSGAPRDPPEAGFVEEDISDWAYSMAPLVPLGRDRVLETQVVEFPPVMVKLGPDYAVFDMRFITPGTTFDEHGNPPGDDTPLIKLLQMEVGVAVLAGNDSATYAGASFYKWDLQRPQVLKLWEGASPEAGVIETNVRARINGLTPGTRFLVKARAWRSDTGGGPQMLPLSHHLWSPTIDFETLPAGAPPPAFDKVAREDVNHKSIVLRWNDIPADKLPLHTVLLGYEVQYQVPLRLVEAAGGVVPPADDEAAWTPYIDPVGRSEVFTYGTSEAALVRMYCNGSTTPLTATQRMLDGIDVAREAATVLTVPAPADGPSCAYSLTVRGLDQLTSYRFRVRTVTRRVPFFMPHSQGVVWDDRDVLVGPWGKPSPRIRTRALPVAKVLGKRPVTALDAGVREYTSVENILNHLLPWPALCAPRKYEAPPDRFLLQDMQFEEGGNGTEGMVVGSGVLGGYASSINTTGGRRTWVDVYGTTPEGASTAMDEAQIKADLLARGTTVVQFDAAVGPSGGGMTDRDYVQGIGVGGAPGVNGSWHGGHGMVLLDVYATSSSVGPSAYLVESLIFAYDDTLTAIPVHIRLGRRIINLGNPNDPEILLPYIYTVPPLASSGDPTSFMVVKAWGPGGGCGTQAADGGSLTPQEVEEEMAAGFAAATKLSPFEEYSDDDGNVVSSHPVHSGFGMRDPPTMCAAGGGGSFITAPITVNPRERVAIIVGTGGKGARGAIGGAGGWPSGGAGGMGFKTGGGGGGGASMVYVLPPTEVAPLPPLERLKMTLMPTVIAAGGGGGGSSDFCCPVGGGGGICAGADGGVPALSSAVTATNSTPFVDPADPAATIDGHIAYIEYLDRGFAPQANYTVAATGGGGASLATLKGGAPGKSGSYRSQDAAYSGAEALQGDGLGVAYSGGWLEAGRGARGYKGGGGGGNGLFGGAGGGAGVDAAGGSGGCSYIHTPALNLPDAPPPVPKAPRVLKVNAISALIEFPVVLWPLATPRFNATAFQSALPRIPAGTVSNQYIIQRSVGPYSEDFSDMAIVLDADIEGAYDAPLNYRRVLLRDLAPGGSYLVRLVAVGPYGIRSLAGQYAAFATPPLQHNEWRRVDALPSTPDSGELGVDPAAAAAAGGLPSSPMTLLPPPLRGASLTAIGPYLYLFGGLSGGYDCSVSGGTNPCLSGIEARSETWRFDPATTQWFKIPVLPAAAPPPRERHTAVAIDGMMYVFGGRGHPDAQRDGGPYLGDVWRFDPGDSSDYSRATVHPGAVAGFRNKNTDGSLSLIPHDISCGVAPLGSSTAAHAATLVASITGGAGVSCGIPDGQSLLATLDVMDDVWAREAYVEAAKVAAANGTASPYNLSDPASIPAAEYRTAIVEGIGEVNATVAPDTCIDSVEVYIDLVHPCLRDVLISLVGPGPKPFRIREGASDDYRPGERGGTGQNVGIPLEALLRGDGTVEGVDAGTRAAQATLKTLGLQEIVLFDGGGGEGTASPDFPCDAEALGAARSLHEMLQTSPPLDVTRSLDDDEALQDPATTDSADNVIRARHDPSLLVFDDGAPRDARACCSRVIPAYLPRVTDLGPQPVDANGTLIETGVGNNDSTCAFVETYDGDLKAAKARKASGTSLARGRFRPRDSLGVYTGLPAVGRWALRVQDRSVNNATGVVRRWGLILKTRPCARPYTWKQVAAQPAGLAGLSGAVAPAPRADAVGVVSGRSWYVWGGRGAVSYDLPYTRDLWRFDFDLAAWFKIAPLTPDMRGASGFSMESMASVAAASLQRSAVVAGLLLSRLPGQALTPTPWGMVSWGGSRPPITELDPLATSLAICTPDVNKPTSINASVTYACSDPSLTLRLWNPARNVWTRVHPSIDPHDPSRVECLGQPACVTPPARMYAAMSLFSPTAAAYPPGADVPESMSIPRMYVYGGAATGSGVLFADLWELRLEERVTLGEPYPVVSAAFGY